GLELWRDLRLLQLPGGPRLEADLLGEHVPGELLRDRAAAARTAVQHAADDGDPHHHRAREAAEAETAVTVEPLVLDRDERLRHVRREVRDGNRRPALLEQLRDEPAVVAEDARGLLGLPDVDLGDGRAVAAHRGPGPEPEPREQGEHRHEHETDAGEQAWACP